MQAQASPDQQLCIEQVFPMFNIYDEDSYAATAQAVTNPRDKAVLDVCATAMIEGQLTLTESALLHRYLGRAVPPSAIPLSPEQQLCISDIFTRFNVYDPTSYWTALETVRDERDRSALTVCGRAMSEGQLTPAEANLLRFYAQRKAPLVPIRKAARPAWQAPLRPQQYRLRSPRRRQATRQPQPRQRTLHNWEAVDSRDGPRIAQLSGDEHTFETEPIDRVDGRTAITRRGKRYTLGRPHSQWLGYLRELGISGAEVRRLRDTERSLSLGLLKKVAT